MMNTDKAQSEVVGWLMAFAVLTATASLIFVSSYPYVTSSMKGSRLEVGEMQMTLLDYTASKTSLGDVPSQTVRFNLNDGSLIVEPGGNNLTIWAVFKNGSLEERYVIYSGPIGRVIYSVNGMEIGYEGGGVWKKTGDSVVMLTPPEFHFKMDTLTLPIIKIDSQGSIGGKGIVGLNIRKEGVTVYYPNTTNNEKFVNPLVCNWLELELKSDFWRGWKTYFEERTDAEITHIDKENKSLRVIMATKSASVERTYLVPIHLNRLNTSDPEPVKTFVINFKDLQSNFDLIWRTNTDPELLILFKKTKGGGNNTFQIAVVYGNDTKYESWQTESGISWDITDDSYSLNLLDDNITMVYQKPQGFTAPTDFPFSNQPESPTWTWGSDVNSTDYVSAEKGDWTAPPKKSLKEVIEHYLRVLAIQTSPDITISEDPKTPGSMGFNKDLTTIELYLEQQPPVITYLHITEHRISIEI